MLSDVNAARDAAPMFESDAGLGSSTREPVRAKDISATLRRAAAQLTDTQLSLVVGAVLFVVGAWPLALTEIPPYQDLPNHLATIAIMRDPAHYPEFVFNGFAKTNAALFAWLFFAGKVLGTNLAARIFALVVCAANALIFPLFVNHFGGRKRMLVASALMWPMVHNWFVSMGMLDFALAVPLSCALLIALDHYRQAPSRRWGIGIVASGILTWYAHTFPLLVVHLLLAIHVVQLKSMRERLREFTTLALPLLPVTLLVALSLYMHVTEPVGAMTGFTKLGKLIPTWELAYNLWAEWFWGFTWLSISSIVPAVVLFVCGYLGRKERPTFFSPLAVATLAFLFVFSPYVATNWFHVNSRFIPFIWLALLVRVPTSIPKKLTAFLALCAVLYSAGMGADFVRLDGDRERFVAGMAHVPEGSNLLPLLFRQKDTSENTRSLLHSWGYYVTDKHTSAPLLFAHSRSFPVMYKNPPTPRFNHLMLEGFAPTMVSAESLCNVLVSASVALDNCNALYSARWTEFWNEATPTYDHVLMWEATPDALAHVPAAYRETFHQDKLRIFERVPQATSSL